MTEFTPGPWKQYDGRIWHYGQPIVKLEWIPPRSGKSIKGNARLIAAAPDGYRLLDKVIQEVQSSGDVSCETIQEIAEWLALVGGESNG